MTPQFVTPNRPGISKRPSTRQLLVKISNYPCLYRHKINGRYYGIKKYRGKRKEHFLGTTDRKLAERKLKKWLADLDTVDAHAEKITLDELLDKFQTIRQGFSKSTRDTERGIINKLKRTWRAGLDLRVSEIKPLMLDEWIGQQRNIRQVLIRRLWQSGIDYKLIAKWQGHRDDGKLILDTYTEVFSAGDGVYENQQLQKIK